VDALHRAGVTIHAQDGARVTVRRSALSRAVLATLAVAVAIAVLELIGPTVNAATAAQILLLVVLADARFLGMQAALVASIFAVAGLFRYFITPKGIAVGDPNDIAALVAFVIMAVVGGELAFRAERRAQEVERLYDQLQAAFERESEAEASRRTERIKATLLDAMAHNLRTPLTAIKMAVTAIMGARVRSASALTHEQQRELLNVIDEESDRLNRFIGGLVEIGGSTDRESINPHTADVVAVVEAALARAETLTRDHHVESNVEKGLPLVRAEEQSLIEVVYMLLDNSSKYAPPETTIRVFASSADDRWVSIRVSDEGPGIPNEFRERVFERFFRIPHRESHDPSRSGGGVGLALAKRLIETQGGRIAIESPSTGPGTVVTLMLPQTGEPRSTTLSPDVASTLAAES
jgi:K+-sensing histidine kinase KdpD